MLYKGDKMKREMINTFIGYIQPKDLDGKPLHEFITELINMKRGFTNCMINKEQDERTTLLRITGERKETEEEFRGRCDYKKELEKLSTPELLKELAKERNSCDRARQTWYPNSDPSEFGESLTQKTIKEVLSTREHIPNKLEKKIIRRLQSQTGIKDVEEIRAKYGNQIKEELSK